MGFNSRSECLPKADLKTPNIQWFFFDLLEESMTPDWGSNYTIVPDKPTKTLLNRERKKPSPKERAFMI